MGGNTKALRVRIKSVNSTLALTNAMGLVAASKIKRANDNMLKAREYTQALEKLILPLVSSKECEKSPYMRKSTALRTKIIVIAGDRGMAGGYNANVFRLCSEFENAEFIPIGKRACERFGREIVSSEHFSYNLAFELSDELCEEFTNEKFDRLGIIYTKYISVMSQETQIRWVLPLEKAQTKQSSVIFEPDRLSVLNLAVREYIAGLLTAYIRESFAGEISARRVAMDSAGKNAKQMIEDLTLEYNRARQGAITQEITEIVAGSGN